MKVIVCGGRNFRDKDFLFREMDRIHKERPITLLIEGGQRKYEPGKGMVGGADYWAYVWAYERKVLHVRENADWDDLSHSDAVIRKNGRGREYDANAGPRRNQLMIDKYHPDAVIPFPGGGGTADMVRRAYECGLEVIGVKA